MLFTARGSAKLVALVVVAILLVVPPLLFRTTAPKTRGFHYIVPTTATNPEVCKLMLSGAITNYPDPVFLGWEGRGRWNGTESHLFKLSETAKYLESLRDDQDDDLVLVLDAFDVWLQLPPHVMIERYFRAIDKQNQRLKKDGIWRAAANHIRVKNTVLFGADKFCWPRNHEKPACWSAPPSPMPPDVLGPDTDTRDFNIRPRYVNSGTIMGPVKDVRDLFNAALWKIDNEWDNGFWLKNSDQHYLGNVWGEQEAARIHLAGGESAVKEAQKQHILSKRGDEAITQKDGRTEFHMAVDHESDAFQIHNFYSKYVTWMTFNHSTASSEVSDGVKAYPPPRLDRLTIDSALASLPGPYAAGIEEDSLPTHKTWRDIMLGTNTVTGQIFPLYHITGEKAVRSWWWPRMWFHPHAEALLVAARRQRVSFLKTEGSHVIAKVRGIDYVALDAQNADVAQRALAKDETNTKGGAWNDLGEYMPWQQICEPHEKDVFLTDKFR